MKKGNMVALVLKIYALVNFLICFVISFALINDYGIGLVLFAIIMSLVINFAIYALGEVVQLLQEIRNNTATKENKDSSDLPSI